ncbi:MAG TPA: hypothetical protein VD763_05970 [Candidatus Saccharimonadales bacterium]|nr:hypothetical protein [Candidatus Saccharimonadales bacterium]
MTTGSILTVTAHARAVAAATREPELERLGRDRDGHDGTLVRDLFAL